MASAEKFPDLGAKRYFHLQKGQEWQATKLLPVSKHRIITLQKINHAAAIATIQEQLFLQLI